MVVSSSICEETVVYTRQIYSKLYSREVMTGIFQERVHFNIFHLVYKMIMKDYDVTIRL